MKHQHAGQHNVTVELPTKELEGLVDKVVDGAITIIATATVAYILGKWVA
jgi:hypothetical protein